MRIIILFTIIISFNGVLAENLSSNPIHPKWVKFKPVFVKGTCPFDISNIHNKDDVICGSVKVPETRSDPGSNLITLQLMKFPALQTSDKTNAILRLDGGPGGPSLDASRAKYLADNTENSLRQIGDVIYHDQRGIGFSDGDICRGIPDAYQYGVPLAPDGMLAFQSTIKQCLEESRNKGINIDSYSTWENALDLRDLRIALGYKKWNLIGTSYGAQLAQVAASLDTEGVRSIVLDSPAPTAAIKTGGWGAVGYGFRTSLQAIDQMCRESAGCTERHGILSKRLIEAIRSFKEKPIILQGLNPSQFLNGKVILDDKLIALFTFQLLYDEDLYRDLPLFIEVLEKKDELALRAYVQAVAWPMDTQIGQGMRFITNCRGSAPLSDKMKSIYHASEPEFSDWLVFHETTENCKAAYKIEPDQSVAEHRSNVPVLIGVGQTDPVTPPFMARQIASNYPNAQYVEFPNTGHSVLFSGSCAKDLLLTFLVSPYEELNIDCITQQKPIIVTTKYRITNAMFQQINLIQNGKLPWGLIINALSAILLLCITLVSIIRLSMVTKWISFIGLIFSTTSYSYAIFTSIKWITEHPLAAPMSLPYSVTAAGWLAIAGCLLNIVALIGSIRDSSKVQILILVTLNFLFSMSIFITLVSIGAGP
ncbi:MAG: alpha/beta fold hydrolase [Kangiellaceae bacterium]|nr:alpha/beta fold hydrolase [Kangiellaceae bacterium]